MIAGLLHLIRGTDDKGMEIIKYLTNHTPVAMP